MVKKSLFARLFSRAESSEDAEKLNGARRNSTLQARSRTRSRTDVGAREGARPAAIGPSAVEEDVAAVREVGFAGGASDRDVAAQRELDEVKPADGPPVRAAEMPRGEELALKLKEGFRGISSVLSGIDQKIDRHQQTSNELIVQVRKIPEMMKDVPDASRAGLELLASISTILESQGRATSELLSRMGDLPRTMSELETHLQEQAEVLSRSGENARRTAEETRDQLSKAFAEVRTKVDGMSATQAEKQDALLRELRRQQGEHDRRVSELIRRSGHATKLSVFLLIVVIAALLLVVQQLGA